MPRTPSAAAEALEPRTFLSAAPKAVASNFDGCVYDVDLRYSYRLINGFVRSGDQFGTFTFHQEAGGGVSIVSTADLFSYFFTVDPSIRIEGSVSPKGEAVFSSVLIGNDYFTTMTGKAKVSADGSKISGGSFTLLHDGGTIKLPTKLAFTATLGGFAGTSVPIGSPITLTNQASVGGVWAGTFVHTDSDLYFERNMTGQKKPPAHTPGSLTLTSQGGALSAQISAGAAYTVSNIEASQLTGITARSIVTVKGSEVPLPTGYVSSYVNGSSLIEVNAKVVMKGKKSYLQGNIAIGGQILTTFSLTKIA